MPTAERMLRKKLKALPEGEISQQIKDLQFEERLRETRAEILRRFRELKAGAVLSKSVTDQESPRN